MTIHVPAGRSDILELLLRNTLAHGAGAADTASHHLQQVVDVVGTAPFLVGDNVDLALHLGLLHQLAVRAHAVLGVRLGELVRDERGRVQTGQRDELPAVAELAETLDVRLLLLGGHGSLPVEGR